MLSNSGKNKKSMEHLDISKIHEDYDKIPEGSPPKKVWTNMEPKSTDNLQVERKSLKKGKKIFRD